ncbi:MAG: ABC transporter permease subunit [Rhizomicrobium sp.]|nr:ABC transporter permease subunit [Rhizomicrobium sp.]
MKRFLARQVAQLMVGLFGAALFAVALSAVTEPRPRSLPAYLLAVLDRLTHLSHGDLGHSAISGLPVVAELFQHLPPTLLLLAAGAAVALAAGLPIGILFAFGSLRRAAAPIMQIVTATPVFCAGLALAFGASEILHWPVGLASRTGLAASPEEALRLAALPIATVGLAGAAAVQLALRRAATRTAAASFRGGLKRLGLSSVEIEAFYVLPQIFAGLIASAGEIALALVSAAVVAEWVFHRDGAADLFVKSVALADWNMTAVILFAVAALTIVASFLGRVLGFLLVREQMP